MSDPQRPDGPPDPWRDLDDNADVFVPDTVRYADVPLVRLVGGALVIDRGDLALHHAEPAAVVAALATHGAQADEQFGVFANNLGDLLVVKPREQLPHGDARYLSYVELNQFAGSVTEIVADLTAAIARIVAASESGWSLKFAEGGDYGFTRWDYPVVR